MLKRLKQRIRHAALKTGISIVRKKCPIIDELLENPENVKLEANIENDEIIIKIKRKSI